MDDLLPTPNKRTVTMLVLSRKTADSIVIDGQIRIEVLQIQRGSVRLGIVAPREISVRRGELLNRDRQDSTVERRVISAEDSIDKSPDLHLSRVEMSTREAASQSAHSSALTTQSEPPAAPLQSHKLRVSSVYIQRELFEEGSNLERTEGRPNRENLSSGQAGVGFRPIDDPTNAMCSNQRSKKRPKKQGEPKPASRTSTESARSTLMAIKAGPANRTDAIRMNSLEDKRPLDDFVSWL